MHTFSGDNQKKGARELLQPCSPNIKTTQISINKEMDYVLYTCNGISSSFENVENSLHATTWKYLEDFILSEISQS